MFLTPTPRKTLCQNENAYTAKNEIHTQETHLSLNIISLKGDYDRLLQFPVTFVLTIRIINSYTDKVVTSQENWSVYTRNPFL